MKFLFASDSFKGTLTSEQTVGLLAKAAKEVFGEIEYSGVPVADGGEGTVDAPMPLEEALERAEELYYLGAVRMFRFIRAGMELGRKSGVTIHG